MELSTVLPLLLLAIAISAIGIGSLAILAPRFMSTNFGISAEKESLGYVIALGVRDIFVGLVFLVLYVHEIWSIASWLCFFLALVAVSDFLTVLTLGDRKLSFVHLIGAVLAIGIGVLFLVFE